MEYRKDIQILRGVAIAFVLLFHLEVPWAGSGFLGVDVFFVISGFLMACLYEPGAMGSFFARRARRILPAYFATVLATLAAAAIVTLPPDLAEVADQAVYATLLVPNAGFWMANSYFAKDVFTPLLHLWSLGVEIQFYVLVPLVTLIAHRFRLFVPLVILLSLAACLLAVGVSPKTAFFMLPFRLWEFLLGFAVALHLTRNGQPRRGGAAFAWLALAALLATPFFGVQGDALSPLAGHPGLGALVACLATAALLALGVPALLTVSPVGTALETLGKYSYSLYLVHFPVITLVLYAPWSGTRLGAPDIATLLAMLAGMAALSWLTYRYIETPLRHARFSWWRVTLAAQVVLIAGALAALPVASSLHSPSANLIFAGTADRAPYRCGKIARLLDPTALTCALRDGAPGAPRILLVGDSHADAIKTAVADAAAEIDAGLRFVVPNEPLMSPAYGPEAIVADAVARDIGHIVVHFSRGNPPADMLARLVELANTAGIRVSYVAPVPVWPANVPKTLHANLRDGTPLPRQTMDDYRTVNAAQRAAVTAIAGAGSTGADFRVYESAPYLCDPDCRMIDEAGRPLYFDTHHLTLTGAARLAGLFRRVLAGD
jgi:peptidoglycan/LPS O-acetylase OafA/YrhL